MPICPRCQSQDELLSVSAILAMNPVEQVRTNGLIIESDGVTPLVANTFYEDSELEQLQNRIRGWIQNPVASKVIGPMFKKSTGWLVIASAWLWSAIAVLGQLQVVLIMVPLSLGYGIWFLATLNKRIQEAGWSQGNSEQREEVARRRQGWYCKRCATLTAN